MDCTIFVEQFHDVASSVADNHLSITRNIHTDRKTEPIGAVGLSAITHQILRLHCTANSWSHNTNSFAADFLAPSAGFLGVKIWKQAIPLTFVNTATIIANGTEGVLSTLVANGTGTVSTIVANGSERVKPLSAQHCSKYGKPKTYTSLAIAVTRWKIMITRRNNKDVDTTT